MPLKRNDIDRQFEQSGLKSKDAGKLQPLLIRIGEKDKKRLEEYFHNRGLKLGPGIRMIIREFIEKEGKL